MHKDMDSQSIYSWFATQTHPIPT